MKSHKFSFEGWDFKKFIKGRKKLLFAAIGYVGGFIVTKDPTLSAIVAAATELILAGIEYYLKEI